jgi:DNA-binding transcriptional LysR family regulator
VNLLSGGAMDINQLRVFTSVYRNLSFTRASEELGISQPTISEHIKNLERELGCPLFDRLTRKIIPTKEAEAMFIKASSIIDDMHALKSTVRAAAGRIRGRLMVGASTIPGTYILPEKIAAFAKKYPRVSFEVIIDDSRRITEGILNHKILLGFVGAVMERDDLIYTPVIEDELILAAPEGLVRNKMILPKDILNLPFIQREEGSGTRKTMETYLKAQRIDPLALNTVAVLGSTASVKEALKAGMGVSIVSNIAVKEDLERGVLREVKIKGLKMKRSFYQVTHKKRVLSEPHKSFYDYMKKG